jgi:hypothetical protein
MYVFMITGIIFTMQPKGFAPYLYVKTDRQRSCEHTMKDFADYQSMQCMFFKPAATDFAIQNDTVPDSLYVFQTVHVLSEHTIRY